jgi:hypothetical protein
MGVLHFLAQKAGHPQGAYTGRFFGRARKRRKKEGKKRASHDFLLQY